eukprot:g56671.t1
MVIILSFYFYFYFYFYFDDPLQVDLANSMPLPDFDDPLQVDLADSDGRSDNYARFGGKTTVAGTCKGFIN